MFKVNRYLEGTLRKRQKRESKYQGNRKIRKRLEQQFREYDIHRVGIQEKMTRENE